MKGVGNGKAQSLWWLHVAGDRRCIDVR